MRCPICLRYKDPPHSTDLPCVPYPRLMFLFVVLWVSGSFLYSNTFQKVLNHGYKVIMRQGDPAQDSVISNLDFDSNNNFSSAARNVSVKGNNKTQPASELTSDSLSQTPSVCNFPEIDPFDPSIEKYLTRHPPLDCSSNVPNIVRLNNDKITIDPVKLKEALVKVKSKGKLGFCQYKVVQRHPKSDKTVIVTSTSDKFTTSIKLKKTEENIRVECYDTNATIISRSYFAIVRVDPGSEGIHDTSFRSHIEKDSPAENLTILMIGLDGLAKQQFARAMPKTREFLVKELGALEMNKHSKLGYSTYPNVIPLLTGYTSEELEDDPRWRLQQYLWMDQIQEAFVWSDARRRGYRTSLMLDESQITAFHYLRKGFSTKPVDHYFRAVVLDSNGDKLMRPGKKNCYGDETEVSKHYDYWLQLLHHYNSTKSNQKPLFAYR